jgi:Mn2+/Fe2+ NRAMP family transporter
MTMTRREIDEELEYTREQLALMTDGQLAGLQLGIAKLAASIGAGTALTWFRTLVDQEVLRRRPPRQSP